MKISHAGLDLIRGFEGVRLKAYKDGGGVWTIGYGSTRGVHKGLVITLEEARERLKNDVAHAENAVMTLVKVPLKQNQFDALVSLVFNCGDAPLRKTLGRRLNKKDYSGAAAEFLKWKFDNGKEIPGLLRRRKAEMELFLDAYLQQV